ncbi:hypothetical protein SAMN04488066_101258 [Halorubrum aquaticum]|uniref:Diguanylate Cyclase and Two-component system sensory domain-containing protein n=1 Tax=Halorubrum aquaticum TaxID=387340 RepID=A0A1I2Z7V7_9EURY|nr:hypothetical protein [Halorubrum aquaticum]SFH33141.1 hypothetical protein SAMN04488066_101258 [Halorubrum aquaticum]
MTLGQLVDRFESAERSIVVVNRSDPDPVRNMLVETFGDGTVRVTEEDLRGDGGAAADVLEAIAAGGSVEADTLSFGDGVGDDVANAENLVLLIEGDEVVAGSTLEELGDAILFVNSDLYTTGARGLDDLELPSVITGLDDTVFTLRGYPESNRQKLLLITVSRFIERAALTAGSGTLRSSFQRLSRLEDELGTRRVYDRVASDGIDTHLYGVPDDPPTDLGATIHGGRSSDFTKSWFVVFDPPDGPRVVDAETDLERAADGGVGLLAVETEPRVWRGVWTFDPDRLTAINRYIRRNLSAAGG